MKELSFIAALDIVAKNWDVLSCKKAGNPAVVYVHNGRFLIKKRGGGMTSWST
jgi:hypothetical protein